MKVELSCTTNLSGKTPRWFHNNQEIKGNNTGITLLSFETEHKAIIHHAQLDDSGEYMIAFDGATSKKSITVTGLKNFFLFNECRFLFHLVNSARVDF